MKFLLIGQNFPPEPGTASSDLRDLADQLAERGHKVTVLTGYPNYPRGRIYPGYRRLPLSSERLTADIRVVRVWHLTTKNWNTTAGRIRVYVSLAGSACVAALFLGRHDLIYISSPPPTLALPGLIARFRSNAKIAMELNDIWPQEAVALGFLSHGPLARFASALESFAYHVSSRIQVYSDRTAEYLLSRGVPPERVSLHSMWVDTERVRPLLDTAARVIRGDYNMGSRFVVTYAGLLGNAQGVRYLIDAFLFLESVRPGEYLLVVAGDGPKLQELEEHASCCPAIRILGLLDKKSALLLQGASDVLILHLLPAGSRLGTIPGKLLYYMALGRPVLACAEGEVAEIVERARCGATVAPAEPQSISNAVVELSTRGDLDQLGANGRAYVVEHFDAARALSERVDELEKMASHSDHGAA